MKSSMIEAVEKGFSESSELSGVFESSGLSEPSPGSVFSEGSVVSVASGLTRPPELSGLSDLPGLPGASEGGASSAQVARREKQSYWAALLERQRSSGLTVAAFCREQRVPMARFFYWKRRLASDGSSSSPAGLCASSSPAGHGRESAPMLFSEFRISHSSDRRPGGVGIVAPCGVAPFEIALGAGASVRVASGFDAGELARLLRAVVEATGPSDGAKGGRP